MVVSFKLTLKDEKHSLSDQRVNKGTEAHKGMMNSEGLVRSTVNVKVDTSREYITDFFYNDSQ